MALSPDDRALWIEVQTDLRRATDTINLLNERLGAAFDERDQARSDAQRWEHEANKLLEDLVGLTERYEALGRQCLILERKAKDYDDLKAQQDRHKVKIGQAELHKAQADTLKMLEQRGTS